MDWLLVFILGATVTAADGATAASGEVAAAVRHSVLIDQQAQDVVVARALTEGIPRDEAVWLDPTGERGLVVCRRAHDGVIKGSVIVVAEGEHGPAGSTHAALIRRGLALHGWHTYFSRLPLVDRAEHLRALVSLVRQRGSEGALVLITEGVGTHWAASVAVDVGVDGLVFINVPATSAEFPAAVTLLGDLALPSLVLQEAPHSWQQEDPLGADVELHLLPRGDARREDNRLIRKIRGWFKRRFALANA